MDNVYQVIIQDEYNNLYQIGFYNKLEDSLADINNWLSVYGVKIDELKEYPGTFSSCFDKEIEIDEGYIGIRGFIFDKKDILEEICDT